MKKLACPETGCRYIVNGINKEEVLRKLAEHRERAHGVKEIAREPSPRSGKHSVK